MYVDGCPSWREAEARLRAALRAVGADEDAIALRRVESAAEAERTGFRGSPTVLVDGVDPFGDRDAPVGLACRVYPTPEGHTGTPTVQALVAALLAAQQRSAGAWH